MKALIATETENLIIHFEQILKDNGYDVITYRWVLKALDNVEEINPDIILISILDYPRQWKVFVKYVQTIYGKNSPKIYIIGKDNFSEKENKDLEILNCKKVTKDTFITIEPKVEIVNPIIEPIKPVIEVSKPLNDFKFNHPKTNEVISGKIKNYNFPMFLFIPDVKNNVKMLRFGMRINDAIFSFDKDILDINVQIQGINDDSIEMCVLGINDKS